MIYEAIDYWNSPYIEHHGVKGMKWGVRKDPESSGMTGRQKRLKRKEIKAYRNKLLSDPKYSYENMKKRVKLTAEKNQLKNKTKIEKLTREAQDLARRYDFDQDDGGGGSTRASQKAGKQYINIWNRIEYLESQGDSTYTQMQHAKYVHDLVNKKVVKKYGRKTIDEAYNTPLYNLAKAYVNSGSMSKTFKWYGGFDKR